MAGTEVLMQREAVLVSGAAKYTITATCQLRGTLQDTGIFLLTIVNDDDPKDDTFLRLIEIADITVYVTDRDTAITNGDGLWRSSSVTLTYDDVETANAAWKELSSRINALVENYDAFLTDFQTFGAGSVIVYPAVDESTKTALKNTYYAANTALEEATAARDDHSCGDIETSISSTETQLQQAQSDLANYTSVLSTLSACVGIYSSVYTGLTTGNTTVRNLNQTSTATDAEKDNIEATLTSNDSLLSQFNTQNSALNTVTYGLVSTMVTTLQTRVTDLTQTKNTLMTDLNKCRTEEATLQAAVTSAQVTRDAALAAVIAVCPDFVP